MFAADRCVVSTLAQALDLAERFPADQVGVVVDTYHLWWDDTVYAQIARAARPDRRVPALPTGSPRCRRACCSAGPARRRLHRLRGSREAVDAAGYAGPIEVEIFNAEVWARPGAEVLAEAIAGYLRTSPDVPERRWPAAVGAWLGIGTAPATLVLGAAMAARHGGAVPVAGLLVGGVLMAALLWGQGRIGLRRPLGDGGTLTAVLPAYLGDTSRLLLAAVLAVSMVGWNGFNVGLGGASLAALTHLPGWAGPVLLEMAVLAVSWAPARLGNRVAVVTTLSAVVLVGWCLTVLPPPGAPVRLAGGGLADAAALIGYAAVFALRAPDFSVGLSRRRDLAWCVGLLIGPALLGVLAGAGLWLRTGSADVVALLAAGSGLAAYANLFVAVAVFAAALTTTYSGSLALRGWLPACRRGRRCCSSRCSADAGGGAVRPAGAALADPAGRRVAGAGGADGRGSRGPSERSCPAYRARLVLGAAGAARGGLHARPAWVSPRCSVWPWPRRAQCSGAAEGARTTRLAAPSGWRASRGR